MFSAEKYEAYSDNYCVVDLETTFSKKIIEIGAVKVRNGQIAEKYSQLINPGEPVGESETVHHITDEMLVNAPLIEKVFPQFLDFIENDIIVGYNYASFDRPLLDETVRKLFPPLPGLPGFYTDLLPIARRSLKNLSNHKLETVSKYFKLDCTGEHRATKDCILTHECYQKIAEKCGKEAFDSYIPERRRYRDKEERPVHPLKRLRHFSKESALKIHDERELEELVEDIILDGIIDGSELERLKTYLQKKPNDRQIEYCKKVEQAVNSAADNEELVEKLSEITDPVKNHLHEKKIETVENLNVCLTGDFTFGARPQVAELLTACGATINKSFLKTKTDILIIGSRGSQLWGQSKAGRKILNAVKAKKKSERNIIICREENIIPYL